MNLPVNVTRNSSNSFRPSRTSFSTNVASSASLWEKKRKANGAHETIELFCP